MAIADLLTRDEGAAARWQLAVCGIDVLLGDLGFDADGKRAILGRVREGFFREFGSGKPLRIQLDQKQRAERRALETLLDPVSGARSDLTAGLAILMDRSERNSALVAELRRLEHARRLTMSVMEIAPSLIHMQVNQLIRSAQRAHEIGALRSPGRDLRLARSTYSAARQGGPPRDRVVAGTAGSAGGSAFRHVTNAFNRRGFAVRSVALDLQRKPGTDDGYALTLIAIFLQVFCRRI